LHKDFIVFSSVLNSIPFQSIVNSLRGMEIHTMIPPWEIHQISLCVSKKNKMLCMC